MFKKSNDKIIFENNGKVYDFLNNLDDYKEIILLLTNPNELEELDLEIEETITEEEKKICKNYKKFIEDFLEDRESILKEVEQKFEEQKNMSISNEENN